MVTREAFRRRFRVLPQAAAVFALLVVHAGAGDDGKGKGEGVNGAAPPACGSGYLQRDPIVLSCGGGHGQAMVILTPAGTPQRVFYWQAPAGAQDLEATAVLSAAMPDAQGVGVTLTVQCADGEVLIDHHRGRLNGTRHIATIDGAEWSWSGDPAAANGHGLFIDGFRVNGTIKCDIEVILSNSGSTPLMGDVEYSWTGVSPCPELRPGCVSCPQDMCHANEFPFCDGSPYWQCAPKSRLRKAVRDFQRAKSAARSETQHEQGGRICCQAMIASCLACAEGKTVEEFCADPIHAKTAGCDKASMAEATSTVDPSTMAVLNKIVGPILTTSPPTDANHTTSSTHSIAGGSASEPSKAPTPLLTTWPTAVVTVVPTTSWTESPTFSLMGQSQPGIEPSHQASRPPTLAPTMTPSSVSTVGTTPEPEVRTRVEAKSAPVTVSTTPQPIAVATQTYQYHPQLLPSWKTACSTILLSGAAIACAFLVGYLCVVIANRPLHYEGSSSWTGNRQFDRLPSNSIEDSNQAQGLLAASSNRTAGSRGGYNPVQGNNDDRSAAGVFS